MKNYQSVITLNKNERGIWDLDPSKGCRSGMQQGSYGCYDDCYAARKAKIYGYDFSTTVFRDFVSLKHQRLIIRQINKIDMSFIRMGCSGDPSENWEHTLNILDKIKTCNKEIVIITKHWNVLTDQQLLQLAHYKVCINTSVSALDKPYQRDKCLHQYHRLKPVCKSMLRIVSCDFNINNPEGHRMFKIQSELFNNENTIDTVFRPTLKNKLVTDGVINIKRQKFMNSIQVLSKFNRKTYIGNCANCVEQCGIFKDQIRQTNIGKQTLLF